MAKIILIEDDATMLSLLQTLLQMEGFETVDFNETTLEGILSVVQKTRPDLALIDVHLRELNGFDLLQRIRQDPDLKSTRVLMSSGMDFRHECLQQGADDFILKPYMPDDLIFAIRRNLKA